MIAISSQCIEVNIPLSSVSVATEKSFIFALPSINLLTFFFLFFLQVIYFICRGSNSSVRTPGLQVGCTHAVQVCNPPGHKRLCAGHAGTLVSMSRGLQKDYLKGGCKKIISRGAAKRLSPGQGCKVTDGLCSGPVDIY